MEQRIIIHTPTGKDAVHVGQVLQRAGINYFACSEPTDVIDELNKGAAGLLMVEEALSVDFLKSITQFLQNQKTWSDLPILLLCKRRLDSPGLRAIYQRLGNVTLIERPLQAITLVTTVAAALRARKRQYEMREMDSRKDEFLAMLAHELRNPLAPISAASQVLKLAELDRERTNRTSDIILRQVSHMTGLIDDLLDLSRVSRGLIQLENEIVDVETIVSSAVEQVSPLISARSHQLTVAPVKESVLIQGDLKRLIQILSNLLNNAAKYTPDGGIIILDVTYNADSVTFNVTDNGLGIEANVLKTVFDMFAQAKRTSDRTQGGLGIGLALVKNLVNLHNGSVSGKSGGLGHGSTFTVTFPRVTSEIKRLPSILTDAIQPTKSRRLLLVDDNEDATDTLGMYLESLGYDVHIEHNAESALESITAQPPDICLLDIGLPDMDGNELARVIRSKQELKNILLIAVTGYGQEQDRQLTKQSGFDYHFVKPVNLPDLLSVLNAPI